MRGSRISLLWWFVNGLRGFRDVQWNVSCTQPYTGSERSAAGIHLGTAKCECGIPLAAGAQSRHFGWCKWALGDDMNVTDDDSVLACVTTMWCDCRRAQRHVWNRHCWRLCVALANCMSFSLFMPVHIEVDFFFPFQKTCYSWWLSETSLDKSKLLIMWKTQKFIFSFTYFINYGYVKKRKKKEEPHISFILFLVHHIRARVVFCVMLRRERLCSCILQYWLFHSLFEFW